MPSCLFRCAETGEEKELFISPVPSGGQLDGWTETVDGGNPYLETRLHSARRNYLPGQRLLLGRGLADGSLQFWRDRNSTKG